jgi:hypothetical protein
MPRRLHQPVPARRRIARLATYPVSENMAAEKRRRVAIA